MWYNSFNKFDFRMPSTTEMVYVKDIKAIIAANNHGQIEMVLDNVRNANHRYITIDDLDVDTLYSNVKKFFADDELVKVTYYTEYLTEKTHKPMASSPKPWIKIELVKTMDVNTKVITLDEVSEQSLYDELANILPLENGIRLEHETATGSSSYGIYSPESLNSYILMVKRFAGKSFKLSWEHSNPFTNETANRIVIDFLDENYHNELNESKESWSRGCAAYYASKKSGEYCGD